ncbi:nuclear transport factor 2 family protein [Actinosynnema sp. NPDC023658]|uniref:nuclear transport factor 2 family protein n=1 Tax=Actinosynnema sp. NPDC023658 TaxID=3155465 RepID=UPI003400D497
MDNGHTVDPRTTVERFLETVISGRPGDLADFYAPTVVIEMPFAATALHPSRIETTREELRSRFAAGAAIRRYTGLDNVLIHQTTDPRTIIVEYALRGEMVDTGEPFHLNYVMVMTVHDGLITHTRDYTDPIAGARVLGKLPELLTALADTDH